MSDSPTQPTKQDPSEIMARGIHASPEFGAALAFDASPRDARTCRFYAEAAIVALTEAGYKIIARDPAEAMLAPV